jgi:rfaE bifunctional protein nucleotidyltransferase chain/domain
MKQRISDKIFSRRAAAELGARLHAEGKRIVFTNGCFDLLHPGHVRYLEEASLLGDVLVVGLNTDQSVRSLDKSPSRPIQDEQARAQVLAALASVGAVVLFDEPTPLELIREIGPDVLVKGADYLPEDIVGYEIVKARGGEILTIPFVPGYSTTSIEKKILEAHRRDA